MARKLVDGISVVVCDWKDPETGEHCNLGNEGEPAMFVDPNRGRNINDHFQCGRHHGIIPQKEKEDFQLPEGHKLNEDVMTASQKRIEIEEIESE